MVVDERAVLITHPRYYRLQRHINLKTALFLGSERTGLTRFVWPYQKSRQNLSLPNFQFVKRGRNETAKYFLTTCVNHMRQEPPSQRSKNFRIYQT